MLSAEAATRRFTAADIKPRARVNTATLPGVLRLGSRLANAFTHMLAGAGGAPWRVTLDHIDTGGSEILQDTGSWFRVESRHGSMSLHIALDPAAVSAACEAALGGDGLEGPYEFPERPLSAIERSILSALLTGLEASVTSALEEQLSTPFRKFESRDQDEPGSGQNLTFFFVANVFGYSGEIRLTANEAEAAVQLDDSPAEGNEMASEGGQRALQQRIATADISFAVGFAAETMTVGDIVSLAPGSLLRLSSTTSSHAILSNASAPVFTASLERAGQRLAVRIIAPVK